MPAADWTPIEIDERGIAHLMGRKIKVTNIALDRIVHGLDAEEIVRQHPPLTLGQVHAALAYYYDHQAECDQQIAEDERFAEQWRLQNQHLMLPSSLHELRNSSA